eukprot:gnl/MRDRNA2_/MRDRNA2_34033_c0_seq1.p1 gnl/MRDRNA2_/MRDRNA2_34033_c0~~gnl/MRDRNA2_/MRDRNA2_34033_c0_seq1.p1  ORF type:complete len:384 (+),score=69.06 gnl/MRDRNA2_/MRDRNA2_34033_c0_seq1:81-1232(+)
MGFLGFIFKSSAVVTALFAILMGLLYSGTLAEMGAFKILDEWNGSRGKFWMGMFPAMHKGTSWGFTEADMPDLSGQTFLVTGANVGLGYWSAWHLAKAKGTVVLGCRNAKKCTDAVNTIKKETGAKSVEPLLMDLNSFKSVIDSAKEFKKKYEKTGLDGLMLNAGIMIPPFELTKDGLESTIGVNHFAHQLLTDELLPLVKQAAKAKGAATVCSVTSAAHYDSYEPGILPSIEAMNDETKYDRPKAYGQSKLANVLFAQELSEKVAGTGVLVNSVHPGGVDTELARHMFDVLRTYLGDAVATFIKENLFPRGGAGAWTPRDAALTQVYATIAAKVKVSGRYFHPIARDNTEFADPHTRDKKLLKHLWKLTETFITDWKKKNNM